MKVTIGVRLAESEAVWRPRVLVLRDGRPGRQGEGGLWVALTLPYVPLPLAKRKSPTGDAYAVSYGRGAARGEQHCELPSGHNRDRYSLSGWKALRGRTGTSGNTCLISLPSLQRHWREPHLEKSAAKRGAHPPATKLQS